MLFLFDEKNIKNKGIILIIIENSGFRPLKNVSVIIVGQSSLRGSGA